jgi:4-hydroxythreonine-4-phosphate dehydrogenase
MFNEPYPRIALTPGEPAGVGPDLAIALAQQEIPAALICIAATSVLRERAAALGCEIELAEVSSASSVDLHVPGRLTVLPVPLRNRVTAGQADEKNARYVLDCLDRAIAGCRQGVTDALVTGPVNKAIINEAGIPFSGHTEYLALHSGADLPVMMLVTGQLRVIWHCAWSALQLRQSGSFVL